MKLIQRYGSGIVCSTHVHNGRFQSTLVYNTIMKVGDAVYLELGATHRICDALLRERESIFQSHKECPTMDWSQC